MRVGEEREGRERGGEKREEMRDREKEKDGFGGGRERGSG